MSRQLRILIVEDVPNDAELALRELKRAGIAVDARRVETAAEYRRELEEFKPQLILSDFTMPNFDGTEALAIARDYFPDIPFIFVSGSVGEEHAIRALKQGANDYVMKTNLVRLAPAVERAIQEQRERAARRDTEYALRASELRKSAIFESALDCIVTMDAQGRAIEFNPAAEKTFGYAREEVLGKELPELIMPPASREAHRQGLKHYLATGEGPILGRRIEVSAMRKDGSELSVELTVVPIRLPEQTLFSAHIRDITERKRAEMQLGDNEERFRQLAENIREVFWLTEPSKNTILYISPAYEHIWGRSLQSLYETPRNWLDAIHPGDRERVLDAAQTKQRSGDYEEQYRIVRPDGSIRWILDRAFPVRDSEGKVYRIAGIAEDITERRRTEEALRQSEYRLDLALAASGLATWEWNFSTREVRFSQHWWPILGYQQDDIPLRIDAWEKLTHPHDLERVKSLVAAAAKGSIPVLEVEYRMRAKNAEWCWIRSVGRVVERDAAGRVVRMTGTHGDITERKQAEQRLRESEERFRQVAENIREVFFLTNAAFTEILYISPAYETIWSRSRESLYANPKSWGDVIHPDDQPRMLENFAKQLQSPQFDYEYRIVRPDGSARWIHARGFPVRDAAGQIYRMAGIAEDITERMRLKVALQEQAAGLQRAQLLAKLAHVITGPGGAFVKWSETLPQLIGVTPAAMPQSTRAWLDILHEDDREKFRTKSIEAAKTGARVDVDYRLWRGDGELIHVRQVIEPIEGQSGQQDGLMWFCTIQDVTEQTRAQERIKRLNRVYAVLSGINALIVRIRNRQELFDEACRIAVEHGGFRVGWIALLDPASGTVTPVAHAGLPTEVGAGSDPAVGLVPAGAAEVALRERRPAFDNDIEANSGSQEGEGAQDTLSLRRAAIGLGAKSVIVLPLFVEGKAFGMLTLYAAERNFFDDDEVTLLSELAGDISFALEFIAKEEKVDYLAYYDALTGLPNRSLFFDQLTHQIGTAKREGLNVALVLIDLDRFRLVNDTLGRRAGDTLLKSVAERIKNAIRDQDSVARVRSNGFAVAISSWGVADIAHIVESRNKAVFERPFLLGQEELRVTATAGVALFPDDGDNPETLFANAEAALRDAKVQNARLQFYSPQMNARVADSLRMENRLRRGLENGEMVLWYQPKVSVKTRKITGFEGLMRWQDPESTLMVSPAQFIPLMERTGLILEAGRWALSQVARDCALWSATGVKPPRIAVNVSPIQLRQKAFVADVIDAAAKTNETGGVLDLEITESVIMENVEAIIPLLQTVRELGVEIAIDDFGTGYSSLAYIARLPIQALKIDRGFIVGMTQSEDSLTIVKSVISLAHSLRLNVVAEGVETEEQAALLLELGCDQMQGYLVSRPIPPQQVPELLRQQNQPAHVKPSSDASPSTKRKKGGTKSVNLLGRR
jgi:diguanylate cyclase (GGDEF)-like protein/PAS domain S-box-containing protein